MPIGRTFTLAAIFCILAAVCSAKPRSKLVNYQFEDGVQLQGYMAWNDDLKGPRPGVLVVHEWWGHNQHARTAADKLAQAGYVALAVDMYGQGKSTALPDSAQAFMERAMRDASTIPGRFGAAFKKLANDSHVDSLRIGAIGYCFGGAVVLAMARQSADLKAIATFHSALATRYPADPGRVKAKLLVMTGGADPLVPPKTVAAFDHEMREANANFHIITYPGAKHGFTNPSSDKAGMAPLGYQAVADRNSWAEMLKFFKKEL